jgi:hypothetical protein
MAKSHRDRASGLDPKNVQVSFAPEVCEAFGDLAGAVHFSEHFDGDMLKSLHEFAAGKAASVDDVIGILPLLAGEAFRHIRATDDKRALSAWQEIGSTLLEHGFTLTNRRMKGK